MENKTICTFRSNIKDIDRNITLNIDSMYPNPCFGGKDRRTGVQHGRKPPAQQPSATGVFP